MDQLVLVSLRKESPKVQSLVSSSTSIFINVSLKIFSLLDILNFDLSSKILVILFDDVFVRFKVKDDLVVNGEELLSIKGDFFIGVSILSITGEFFGKNEISDFFWRNKGDLMFSVLDGLNRDEFCISPRILRFDGVWVGEFKSSDCGSILSL